MKNGDKSIKKDEGLVISRPMKIYNLKNINTNQLQPRSDRGLKENMVIHTNPDEEEVDNIYENLKSFVKDVPTTETRKKYIKQDHKKQTQNRFLKINKDFEYQQNTNSKRRVMFKKIDIENTLAGKFSNRFKETLSKQTQMMNNFSIIPSEQHLSETLTVIKIDQGNIKNISCECNLPISPDLPVIGNFDEDGSFKYNNTKYHKNSETLDSNKYNHNIHLKQKFLNHKKLFKNQQEVKKLYYMMNNVQSEVNKIKLHSQFKGNNSYNFNSTENKNKIKKTIFKMIDFRKGFQDRLAKKSMYYTDSYT